MKLMENKTLTAHLRLGEAKGAAERRARVPEPYSAQLHGKEALTLRQCNSLSADLCNSLPRLLPSCPLTHPPRASFRRHGARSCLKAF